jgi:hypothetical protein
MKCYFRLPGFSSVPSFYVDFVSDEWLHMVVRVNCIKLPLIGQIYQIVPLRFSDRNLPYFCNFFFLPKNGMIECELAQFLTSEVCYK